MYWDCIDLGSGNGRSRRVLAARRRTPMSVAASQENRGGSAGTLGKVEEEQTEPVNGNNG
jgi:hypothetical protein